MTSSVNTWVSDSDPCVGSLPTDEELYSYLKELWDQRITTITRIMSSFNHISF
jgi:hypothetical protein